MDDFVEFVPTLERTGELNRIARAMTATWPKDLSPGEAMGICLGLAIELALGMGLRLPSLLETIRRQWAQRAADHRRAV